MCFGSGAERKRAPRWRTRHVFITRAGRWSAAGSRPPRASAGRSATGCDPGSTASCRRGAPPSSRPASPRRQRSAGVWHAAVAAAEFGCRRLRQSSAQRSWESRWMAVGPLKVLRKAPEPPAGGSWRMPKNLYPTNRLRLPDGRAFPLPSKGRVHVPSLRHTQFSPTALQSTIAHCNRPLSNRATNSPLDCGTRPVKSSRRRSFVRRGDNCFSAG